MSVALAPGREIPSVQSEVPWERDQARSSSAGREARASQSLQLPQCSEGERGSRFPIYFYLVDRMPFNVKCSVEEEISATAELIGV